MFESRCLVGWRDRESGRRDRRDGGRERSREHGSGSAVSLGANESHLGGPAPGVSQQAFRLLEQLQHTVRPPSLLILVCVSFLCCPPGKVKENDLHSLSCHHFDSVSVYCCFEFCLIVSLRYFLQGCGSHLSSSLLNARNNLEPTHKLFRQASHVFSVWWSYF